MSTVDTDVVDRNRYGEATRLTVAGAIGSVMMAAGSFGAGATLWADPNEAPFAEHFADVTVGYGIGLGVWLVGAVLLATAWWRLGRLVRAGALTGRRMTATALIWAVPFLFSAPMGSRDIYAYACQGLLYAHGLNPYAMGPAALPSPWLPAMTAYWQHTPAPYGPLALLLSRVAAALAGGHLVLALGWLRLAAVTGVALIAVFVPRLARACGVPPVEAAWLGAASPLVAVDLLSAAHHDALMIGLLLAGLDLAARRRAWPTGIVLGLAGAVKVTALIAVPFAAVLVAPAFTGRHRLVRGGAVVALPAVAAFLALTGVSRLGFGWIRATPGPHSLIHWLSPPSGVGLVAGELLRLTGYPHAIATTVPIVRAVAWYVVLPAVLVALWWRIRQTTDPRRVVEQAGYALAATVLLSPLVYPWYYLAPIAVLAVAITEPRVRTVLAVVTLFGLFVIFPDGFNLAYPTKWVGAVADVFVLAFLAIRAVRIGAMPSRAAERSPEKAAEGQVVDGHSRRGT